MRPGRSAGGTNAADKLSPLDFLTLFDVEFREVTVVGRQTTTVIDNYQSAVAALPADKSNFPLGACHHWRAGRHHNVLARMEFVRTASKGIPTTTEAAFK